MAVRITLECGNTSTLKKQKTLEGFTHDWEVFVRGCGDADISQFIDKVIFHLHETFPKPKRTVKEPPYLLRESGYAGFVIPIHVYLKTGKNEPKRFFEILYDLELQPTGPPRSRLHNHVEDLTDLTDDLRKRLLRGGAVSIPVPDSTDKEDIKSVPMVGKVVKSSDGKRHRSSEPKNEFSELFGTPIKTVKTSQVELKKPPPSAVKPPDPKPSLPTSTKNDQQLSVDKNKSKPHPSPHKDSKKDKSDKLEKKDKSEKSEKSDKLDKTSNKLDKTSQPVTKPPSPPVVVNKEKRALSPKPRDKEPNKKLAVEKKKKHKEDRDKEKREKHKDKDKDKERKSSSSEKKSESKSKSKDSEKPRDKEKKDKDKHRHKKKDKKDRRDGSKEREKKEKQREKVLTNHSDSDSPPPMTELPVTENKSSEKKRDRTSSSRSEGRENKKKKRKDEKEKEIKEEETPQKDSSPMVEPVSSSQSPMDKPSVMDLKILKGEVDHVVPDSTNAAFVEEIANFSEEYVSQLKDLQKKIMTLQDNQELQRVVSVIAETGQYEITKKTFDFDLCLLDKGTVQKLQQFFAS